VQCFGDALRQHRTAAGLTQEELAVRTGLSVRAIREMERGGSSSLYQRSVRLLAEALSLTDAQRGELRDLARGRADGTGPAGIAVPGQLPAGVAQFVGRERELRALDELLRQADPVTAGSMVLISAIAGTAGIGKTALAVHWARRAAANFPDGQLYVNLRGFGPSAPMPPAEAVSGFLAALGVPPERWPPGFDAQAAMYRGLAAGRRLLIVLDNARDAEQVRPLLPGSPGCLALVTSRASLGGLAVSAGAHLLTLDVLAEDEGRRLLNRRLGSERVATEPGAVTELIRLCAQLPLALAVVAARASVRPGFPLAALAAELRDESGRLDALEAGDPATSMRAVISWSYQSLTEPAARMFTLLGLHPGPDVTAQAAASAAGVPLPAARRSLRELTQANLLSEHLPGRFGCHDLLRAYAAERARAAGEQDPREATGRILDHYLHTGHAAALLLGPQRETIVAAPPQPGVAPEQLASHEQAMAWFEAERQVLLAAIPAAADSGFDVHAWQIPWTMGTYFGRRGHWQQWAATARAAVAAAIRLGDAVAQALSRSNLAMACTRLGDNDQARTQLGHCLELYRQLGDQVGESRAHRSLGVLANEQGRHADALGHCQQALRLLQDAGHQTGQAVTLNDVGWCHALLGNYQQARVFCQQAITLSCELGHRDGQATAWDSLGYAEHHLGRHAEAAACYRQALRLFRELSDRFNEAEVLNHLGDTRHAGGESTLAREAWQQALDILGELGHPRADLVSGKLRRLASAAAAAP
jgi:tetratricopeptide (TPR) repeat protein/transcriptional regulator with XRE-family HTH domain